jgi:hypothetical protein
MRRTLEQAWLPVVGTCAFLLGCANSHTSHYPPDPLLLSKKPIESRSATAAPAVVAQHEPRAPESLAVALAAASTDNNAIEDRPRRPVPATPASLRSGENEMR